MFLRKRGETRIWFAAALLLTLYVGLVGASLPGWSSSTGLGGSSSLGPVSMPAGASQVALAASGTPVVAEKSPATPSTRPSTPNPTASPARLWTPPPFKPTPRPTAEPDRLYHIPILMYHRVIPTSEAGDSMPDLVVSPEMFSSQMKGLFDAGWHSITMATLADDMDTDRTIPAKTFVITFDDGWSDGYDYAFPIMRQYGFVATYFVIGGRIDRGPDFLSTTQLRTLEAAGNDIGNHTWDHIDLTTVPLATVTREVEAASEGIARAVGHRPVSLAYPMGGIDTPVAITVSQVPGIEIAVHTGFGTYETWFGRYDMPRVRIHPDTGPDQILAWLNR